MTHRWLLAAAAALVGSPLAAQAGRGPETAPTMLPGKYTIEARDTSRAFPPIAFELKRNTIFVITMPDGIFSGKMKSRDGILAYSDQGCLDEKNIQREGTYLVRSERGGFWLDVQSDPCEDRGKSLASWLFRPIRK